MQFNFKLMNITAKKASGIYSIMCKTTNKSYIGSSKNVKQRLQCHRSYLRKDVHLNPVLQNAWNKYKEDNFICFVIEYCSENELVIKEQYYINIYGDFNLIKDVQRWKIPEDSKKRMSITRKKMFRTGELVPYQIKKVFQYSMEGVFIKEWDSGIQASEELHIQKSDISSCITNHRKSAGGFLWTDVYYETVPKYYRKTNKGRSFNLKKVCVEDTYNGKILTFPSLVSCTEFFKVSKTSFTYYIKRKILYKSIYKIYYADLVKSDKLLETPEEDNQQPI